MVGKGIKKYGNGNIINNVTVTGIRLIIRLFISNYGTCGKGVPIQSCKTRLQLRFGTLLGILFLTVVSLCLTHSLG